MSKPLIHDEGHRLIVDCPAHGYAIFTPDSRDEARKWANRHCDCSAPEVPPPSATRRPKSRRTPLVQVIQRPATAPAADEGRSAPSHMGATLGFAPAPRRDWRSPGTVRL